MARVTMNSVNQTEVVHRPEPGLARGIKEAPPAVFIVVLVLSVALLALFGALHILKSRRRKQ